MAESYERNEWRRGMSRKMSSWRKQQRTESPRTRFHLSKTLLIKTRGCLRIGMTMVREDR